MTEIRIKIICRQTGPYGRVPQNRFRFVRNCEWRVTKNRPNVTLGLFFVGFWPSWFHWLYSMIKSILLGKFAFGAIESWLCQIGSRKNSSLTWSRSRIFLLKYAGSQWRHLLLSLRPSLSLDIRWAWRQLINAHSSNLIPKWPINVFPRRFPNSNPNSIYPISLVCFSN